MYAVGLYRHGDRIDRPGKQIKNRRSIKTETA